MRPERAMSHGKVDVCESAAVRRNGKVYYREYSRVDEELVLVWVRSKTLASIGIVLVRSAMPCARRSPRRNSVFAMRNSMAPRPLRLAFGVPTTVSEI
jgi:hypothetical protein